MAKKTKAQLKAEYEKAKKSGKVKEAGIGNVASTAAKLAIKVVKSTKAANAAKAAEKTTKNLPKAPTVKNPPKPPMGQRSPQSSGSKAIEDMWVRDAKLKAQRAADLAEDRKRLAQMARDRVANKPKPSKKGPSSGNIASYNWLGK